MSSISKEEATKRIFKHIEEINKLPNRDLEFIGFKDNIWSNKRSYIIIKCKIHNTITETQYSTFQSKKSWGCRKCQEDSIKKSIMKITTEEEAIAVINNKIEEEKKMGFDLEFLGFVGEYKTISSTKLKIRCKTHNQIGTPPGHVFLKKGFMCHKCTGKHNKEIIQISNQEIYNRLIDKFGDTNYDFSSILSEEELGSRAGRVITFYCKIHNKFTTKELRGLLNQKGNIPCHDCYVESLQEKNKQDYLKRIEEGIQYRKSLGYDITFLGFAEEWKGCYTRLRLMCNIHGCIWETTTARNFINGESLIGCPECCNALNKSETQCFEIIKELGIIPDLKRQKTISVFDNQLGINRNLKVDFFSVILNMAIEFDGEQHTKFVKRFHENKEGYLDQLRRDELKNKYCEENGIKLLRITYKEKKRDIGNVVRTFVDTGEDISIKLTPEPFPEDI